MLRKFGCIIAPTSKAITTDLGVNTKEYIVTLDKPVIKEIKRILASFVEYNNTA